MRTEREGGQASLRRKQNAVEGRPGDKTGTTSSWGACPLWSFIAGKVLGTSAVCAGKLGGSSAGGLSTHTVRALTAGSAARAGTGTGM